MRNQQLRRSLLRVVGGIAVILLTLGLVGEPVVGSRQAQETYPGPNDESVWDWRFDFGTGISPVEDGWLRVTEANIWQVGDTFGWLDTTQLESIDQSQHNDLDRDFVQGKSSGTFRVRLPATDAEYEVWLLINNIAQDVSLTRVTLSSSVLIVGPNEIKLPWMRSDSLQPADANLTAMKGIPTTKYWWSVKVGGDPYLNIHIQSSSGVWQINALAIKRQRHGNTGKSYEVAVSNVHTAPNTMNLPLFTIPSRFWWNSNAFLNTPQHSKLDWSLVSDWVNALSPLDASSKEKFLAAMKEIRGFSGDWSPSNHPVDVILQGNGSCTGIANLTTMIAWTLGLPARNLVIYVDSSADLLANLPTDPIHDSDGQAHEVSEVYLDGEWRTFEYGVMLSNFVEHQVESVEVGIVPGYHRYSARTVIYSGFDGTDLWKAIYSPSTAGLLYPKYNDHYYRLLTHDPRTPNLLRIDNAIAQEDGGIDIIPGVNVLRKNFWLSSLQPDVERVVTRIPISQNYVGLPTTDNWYIRINGHEHRLGRANTDWNANSGAMIQVDIPFNELRVGWNVFELAAHSRNGSEKLVLSSSQFATNNQATLISGAKIAQVNPVWLLDVEYSTKVDQAPPSAVNDMRMVGQAEGEYSVVWTAPGDDLRKGQAQTFELRYLPDPIVPESWRDATVVLKGAYAVSTGEMQIAQISDLPSGRSGYLALKSYDESGNPSLLSNSVWIGQERETSVSAITSSPTKPEQVVMLDYLKNGNGFVLPDSSAFYMWLTGIQVSSTDTVEYILFVPQMDSGQCYQLEFEFFNSYDTEIMQSVFYRIEIADQVLWEYGIGGGLPVGWIAQTVNFVPQAGDVLRFSIRVREMPEQWEWGKHAKTGFRKLSPQMVPAGCSDN